MAAHVALLGVFDLSRRPVLGLALFAAAFAAYLGTVPRLEKRLDGIHVILVAAVLRLVLLPLPPSLSDDLLRYVWDGKVVAAGFDPYGLAPEAPELTGLRDDLWRRMPHRDVPSVYPPVAMGLFTLASGLPWPLTGLKILLASADLAGCVVLLRLARRLELPAGRVAWYAWNPLVAMEVAGMGHVDALGVAACVAAVWLLSSARPVRAGLAAAAGVLAKLVPVVVLPLWTVAAGPRRGRFALAAALALALAGLPVLVAHGGAPPGLVKYGISWEFNGPLYEPLWRAFRAAELDAAVKHGLDALKEHTGHHDRWNELYPFVYPQLLAKLVLTAALLGVVGAGALRARRRPATTSASEDGRWWVAATGRVVGGALLCSATLYPWYILWVLPWAALARHRAWLALSALMVLAYASRLFAVEHVPWLFLALWGPFFLFLLRSSWSFD